MAFLKVKNRAISTLASGVDDDDTEWTLATGEGALFPTSGDFHVTCEDEIAKCTSRSTDVLTVIRAQEGTAAAAHTSGKAVKLQITAGVIENVQDEIENLLWTPKIYTSVIAWVSLDGCTTSIPGEGSVAIGATALLLGSGATADNNVLCRTTYGFNNPWPTGKECTVEFPISYLAGTANHRIIFLMTTSTALPPSETVDHVGFIIDGNDLYSSSGDNTDQETQDTGIDIPSAGACLYQCKVVIDPGVSAKFYVNGILKTTHTTRPPRADQAGGMALSFGVETTEDEAQTAAWERIVVTKEL